MRISRRNTIGGYRYGRIRRVLAGGTAKIGNGTLSHCKNSTYEARNSSLRLRRHLSEPNFLILVGVPLSKIITDTSEYSIRAVNYDRYIARRGIVVDR